MTGSVSIVILGGAGLAATIVIISGPLIVHGKGGGRLAALLLSSDAAFDFVDDYLVGNYATVLLETRGVESGTA